MQKILSLAVLVFSSIHLFAQKIDKKLQNQVELIIRDFQGSIGIYIKNLDITKLFPLMLTLCFPRQAW